MIRLLSLLALVALFAIAWSLGSADPRRLAAFQVGDVLDQPVQRLAGPGAAELWQPGDAVLIVDPGASLPRADQDSRATIERIDGDQVFGPGGVVLPAERLQLIASHAVIGRLLRQLEPDDWQQRIRLGDLLVRSDGSQGPVQAIEDGVWVLEDGSRVPLEEIAAWWAPDRSFLEVMDATRLTGSVLQADGKAGTKLRLGAVEAATDGDDSVALQDARLSLVRKLRSHFSGDGLIDQDLTKATADGVRFSVQREDTWGLTLSAEVGSNGLQAIASQDRPLPSAWSLAPPLIAILLAILLRAPVLALLAGVLGGSWVVVVLQTGSVGAMLGEGTIAVADSYLRTVLFDRFRFEIIGFVLAMLAMVGVMTSAGGIAGLMQRIAHLAGNARKTQFATWIMGLAVFFDDYANTILVGTTMRPLTDKVKVAREKLAYIVDSTAAPVAGLSLFSTWIAFEVSTFQSALPDAGLSVNDGYAVFLQTLPYRFYCLFTLAFVGMVVLSGRDMGPMLRAERRARAGQLLNPGSSPMVGKSATELDAHPSVTPQARVAVLPLLTFIGVTLLSILSIGGAFGSTELGTLQGWANVLYDGSGSAPLLYGSLAGLAVALAFGIAQGLRAELLHAAWASIRSMGVALAILYLAWMLGEVCQDLGTSTYLTVQLGESITPLVLPIVLFLLAALVAFSTGSSWSTMTILLPLVVGLSFQLGSTAAIGGLLLMVMSIGAVLEGAIFGDHCSPISDTTVMSSIASASDHIDHVRTQMPYALLTMGVALVIGYLPCAYWGAAAGPWLPFACLGFGLVLLFVILRTFGARADDHAPAA